MIPDDKPTVQSPDSSEDFDDDVEKEMTAKKKTTTFDKPNNIPLSNENTTTLIKYLDLPPNSNNTMTQRTIEIATAAIVVNHRITPPLTLQL